MQTRILSALIAMAVVGNAFAQDVPPPPPTPPPAAGMAPAPHPGSLPPLPPDCMGGVPMAPPLPPPMPSTDAAYTRALGLSSAQAAKVQQVFEKQATQAQRLDQQRRDMDATTCRNLRDILGDQGMTRWASMMPPPPPPRAPGATPPPPPPAQ